MAKCARPEDVLQYSDHLRTTSHDVPFDKAVEPVALNWSMDAFGQTLHLAMTVVSSPDVGSTVANDMAATEDPLVATVLGGPAQVSTAAVEGPLQPAVRNASVVDTSSSVPTAANYEAEVLGSMVVFLQSWWMLMLATPSEGFSSDQVATIMRQNRQFRAQLPRVTQLSQLMAATMSCCASLPSSMVSDAAYSPTHCAMDKLSSGSAGDGEEDKGKPKCKRGHVMVQSTYQLGNYSAGWGCDACNSGTEPPGTRRWMCMTCLQTTGDGTDYCFGCFGETLGGTYPFPK